MRDAIGNRTRDMRLPPERAAAGGDDYDISRSMQARAFLCQSPIVEIGNERL
jgi:hypothetical protein